MSADQNNRLENRHAPFWFLTFSLMAGLTLTKLIQDGMFMDAMLYTSVAHNLSQGIGTFWFPQFSYHNVAGLPSFHEQPPLVFGIQSVFFRLLGDSMYVERFYTFLALITTSLLVIVLWKEIYKGKKNYIHFSWLPLVLWITIPSSFWSFSNNMLENTMGIFTLCSVLLSYQALRKEKFQFLIWLLSGLFIFLATFSKGFPGFFPVMTPLLYWAVIKRGNLSKFILPTAILIAVPLLIYAILFLLPESKESLSFYLFKRALHRIQEAPTVGNRFYILQQLFMEMLPQLILLLVLFAIAGFGKIKKLIGGQMREAAFFLAVGLSASAPLMLTLVQKSFYFVPALPFFGIGLSMLGVPIVAMLVERMDPRKLKSRLFLVLSMVLFMATISFTFLQKGKTSRDKELLHDIYLIGTVIPRESLVSVSPEMWNEWNIQCYLIRYFNISVEAGYKNKFCILDENNPADLPEGYHKIDIPTLQFHLYRQN